VNRSQWGLRGEFIHLYLSLQGVRQERSESISWMRIHLMDIWRYWAKESFIIADKEASGIVEEIDVVDGRDEGVDRDSE
jgi:hypothetical protein